MADLTADQQAQVVALLRQRLVAARAAVKAFGDGDSQRDALYALDNSEREVNGLESNAARRLAQGPIAGYDTGADLWLHDAREVEGIIDGLPGDAKQGTIEDVLVQTAKATATDTAQLAGNALNAAAGAGGFVLGAFWSALPAWAKVGVVVAGVGVVGFVGYQVYALATAPRRAAAAAAALAGAV